MIRYSASRRIFNRFWAGRLKTEETQNLAFTGSLELVNEVMAKFRLSKKSNDKNFGILNFNGFVSKTHFFIQLNDSILLSLYFRLGNVKNPAEVIVDGKIGGKYSWLNPQLESIKVRLGLKKSATCLFPSQNLQSLSKNRRNPSFPDLAVVGRHG